MTATAESLKYPDEIVDEYVRLGFTEVFLRPLSLYGFAKRNQALLGYGHHRYQEFYERALARIEYWAKQGVELREVYAGIILNKLLSTFDAGYVDLQSPTAAGAAVLVYNYDGYVYPSDEARMLAETGDTSLRMGRIGAPLADLQQSQVRRNLVAAGEASRNASCSSCAYQAYCAPNPIDAQAQFGRMDVNASETVHCARHLALFDFWVERLRSATPEELDRYHAWADCSRSRQ
jgi:radical SAM protein with 4Fe4S-binding SPASM domain